jgi:hypothetical protein
MVKRFGDESVLYGWLRNRNTVEFLGVWELINNPAFKPVEFERFKSQAGLNSFSLSPSKWVEATGAIGLYAKAASEADLLNVALFGMTSAHWRDANPSAMGNMRDAATLEQLVVLSNLESINAVLIYQGIDASERLQQLNAIAITQMRSLIRLESIKQLVAGPRRPIPPVPKLEDSAIDATDRRKTSPGDLP